MRLPEPRTSPDPTGLLRVAGSVAVLLVAACASSSTQLADLETGLSAVERRLVELQSRTPTQQDLAEVVQALENQADSEVAANADLKEDLRQILSDLEALRNLVQEQRQILNATVDRLEQTGTDVALIQGRLERQEAYLSALDQLQEASRATAAAEAVDPKVLYDAPTGTTPRGGTSARSPAFVAIWIRFQTAPTRTARSTGSESPTSAVGSNRAAIEELGLVRQDYPESDKVPSAMLKVGVALNELGDRELAIEMFLRVRSSYPDTDEAILALQQLDNLGAGQ